MSTSNTSKHPSQRRYPPELRERAVRMVREAIAEGGWFDSAHEQAVREASAAEDPHERLRSVKTLLAEETRLGMLVGVAVGFELSRALEDLDTENQQED